ncbi:MAG: transglycosylase SLT domain-containing protein [Nitrospira sp.]|nr:transglycosylase SLT domain-containing protein [Nitrospira sp.]MBP6607278.1 transglycosylase SLT domain-containing protein [Nitrospira sp.]HQY58416.1 transglycosylase SLT domain-containing protein [Nitrospira sp.]
MTAFPWRISLSALVMWSVLSSLFLTATAESPRPLPVAAAPCVSAEDCFRSAVALNERSGSPVQRDQTMMLKIDQLRSVMDLYPSTIWAKRAGVVLGVLLIERDPVEAAKRLQAVQPDMPVLDDYLRLWIGESLLKRNEPIQAAELLETIPKVVPDSNLIAKAAYRTGEAWYSANVCFRAVDWLTRAVALAEKDPSAPLALWHQAECHIRENRLPDARTALTQLWLRYPQSLEAREAKARLDTALGGESWAPTADDHLIRAQAFLGLAMQAEAGEELRRVLAMAPGHPRRFDARLKLGVAYVRLKQYDQARETFRGLVADRVQESAEATVWLARVYLRQSQGDKLIALARSVAQGSLGGDQRAMVHLFAGVWLEDQGQFDEAIEMFRQVAKVGDSASQRAEGLWRAGWAQYRTARYRDAAETFRSVVELHVNGFEPQAMYWAARADEREKNTTVADQYTRLCQRHAYSYYCQLAARRLSLPPATPVATSTERPASEEASRLPENRRSEIERHVVYQRGIELKILGFAQDAARELGSLTEHYSRDPEVLLAFSTLLSEVGAYYPALRVAKVHFKEKLERSGQPTAPALWTVAYPTGLLPTITAQGITAVDPYLAAAIIREESQYDEKAVSMVGAVGLMQLMPVTANAVAQRYGFPAVGREELFDQETNIRLGVRYLGQLLEQYGGNLAYAVAAYNAGPIAVNSWIAVHRGREQDEFVELIPYQETRLYVKRVLRSYGEYRRLHHGTS